MPEDREISPTDILDALANLEADAGIRVQDGSGCTVFITRSAGQFCLNISSGSNESWFYANTPEEALDLLKRNTKQPLHAWLY